MVFQADVFAVSACVQNIIKRYVISIFKYAQKVTLRVLGVVLECIRAFSLLGRKIRIQLRDPDHNDVTGNERINMLTIQGRSSEFEGPEPVLAVTNFVR